MQENRDFFDNFPFAVNVLQNPREHGIYLMDENGLKDNDELAIEFKVADGRLLFRQNLNGGLAGSFSCYRSMEKNRENQVGASQNVLFATDANGQVLRVLHWPNSDEDEKYGESEPVFARNIFFKHDSRSNLFDKIAFLVLLESDEWCLDTKNNDVPRGRFGELQSREVKITVYHEPSCGFGKLLRQSNIYEHLHLNNTILSGGTIRKNIDILCINGHLAEMCIQFQMQVYDNGMRSLYENDFTRGFSLSFSEDEKILVYEIAGIRKVQLENKDALISFHAKNDYKNLYFYSCQGTLPDIRKLVLDVIRKWHNPEVRKRFQPDNSVGLSI